MSTRAVVLLLHGGREQSTDTSRRHDLSALRMLPFELALRRAGRDAGVVVRQVRYRVRGWNGPEASPVADGSRALQDVRRRHGPVPVVLVGHSMGGRVALRLAAERGVAGVVALAPWVPPGEPLAVAPGCVLRVVHAEGDTVTSPAASLALTERAALLGVDARHQLVLRSNHSMLRRAAVWHALAGSLTAECLEPHGIRLPV